MAKYKELNKKNKIVFYVALFLALVYGMFFCLFLWNVGSLLYHQEYFKAVAYVSFFLTGWYWTTARKRKKKIAELEHELVMLKVFKANWKSAEGEWFVEGWQAAIAYQRQILNLRKASRG